MPGGGGQQASGVSGHATLHLVEKQLNLNMVFGSRQLLEGYTPIPDIRPKCPGLISKDGGCVGCVRGSKLDPAILGVDSYGKPVHVTLAGA